MNGMISLLAKAHILKKIYLPKWLIIVSSTIHSSLAFFFNLIILFLFLFFYYHIYPNPIHILAFLLYVLLIYGISLIFSFATAALYVRLRDLNQIWELLLQVLFYASPIIYPFTAVPEHVRSLLYLNPMTLLIEHSRIALIDNGIARLDHLFIFIGIFIPCFLGSIWLMNKTSDKIIENM